MECPVTDGTPVSIARVVGGRNLVSIARGWVGGRSSCRALAHVFRDPLERAQAPCPESSLLSPCLSSVCSSAARLIPVSCSACPTGKRLLPASIEWVPEGPWLACWALVTTLIQPIPWPGEGRVICVLQQTLQSLQVATGHEAGSPRVPHSALSQPLGIGAPALGAHAPDLGKGSVVGATWVRERRQSEPVISGESGTRWLEKLALVWEEEHGLRSGQKYAWC